MMQLAAKKQRRHQREPLGLGVVRVGVGEALELELVDVVDERLVERRQQRLVGREGALEVRNVHRVALKSPF